MGDELHEAFCQASELRLQLDMIRYSYKDEDRRDLDHLHELAKEILDTLQDMVFGCPDAEG